MEKYTLSILVDNKYGVLTRIAGLFARRGYNIDNLSVGKTHNDGQSRLTVVTEGTPSSITSIIKQLEKVVDVQGVAIMHEKESVMRELMLIKVKAEDNLPKITEVVNIYRASIVDLKPDSVIVAIMGEGDKLDAFLEYLKTFEILEVSRTGLTVLGRGSSVL